MAIELLRSDGMWTNTGWPSFESIMKHKDNASYGKQKFTDRKYTYLFLIEDNFIVYWFRLKKSTYTIQQAEQKFNILIEE